MLQISLEGELVMNSSACCWRWRRASTLMAPKTGDFQEPAAIGAPTGGLRPACPAATNRGAQGPGVGTNHLTCPPQQPAAKDLAWPRAVRCPRCGAVRGAFSMPATSSTLGGASMRWWRSPTHTLGRTVGGGTAMTSGARPPSTVGLERLGEPSTRPHSRRGSNRRRTSPSTRGH
jgi:hypothetical protein